MSLLNELVAIFAPNSGQRYFKLKYTHRYNIIYIVYLWIEGRRPSARSLKQWCDQVIMNLIMNCW